MIKRNWECLICEDCSKPLGFVLQADDNPDCLFGLCLDCAAERLTHLLAVETEASEEIAEASSDNPS